MKNLILLFVSLFIFSCDSSTSFVKKQKIVGTWESTDLFNLDEHGKIIFFKDGSGLITIVEKNINFKWKTQDSILHITKEDNFNDVMVIEYEIDNNLMIWYEKSDNNRNEPLVFYRK